MLRLCLSHVGMMIAESKVQLSKVTEKRVKLTSSFIHGIIQVKMLTWEDSFISKVEEVISWRFSILTSL